MNTLPTMTKLRCTKKLLDRLKLPAKPETTTGLGESSSKLGDWYATYLPCRPNHLVLAISQKCRLAILLPAAPLLTLEPRFQVALRQRLEALCISDEAVEHELAAMGTLAFIPTGSDRCRSTMGTMTQFLELVEHNLEREKTPEEIALYLGRYLVGQKDYYRPEDAARELLDPNTVTEESRWALELRITIEDSTPPIWRRFLVPATLSLHHLHKLIQSAFGWQSCHLHEFTVGEVTYGIRDPYAFQPDEGPDKSDRALSLFRALPDEGSRLLYAYDMGDNWRHEVVLEKRIESNTHISRCLAGERNSPPEDCGGIMVYQDVLTALSGGSSELDGAELAEWLEWAGPGFDPAAFNLEAINVLLRRSW